MTNIILIAVLNRMNAAKSLRDRFREMVRVLVRFALFAVWVRAFVWTIGTFPSKFDWLASVYPMAARLVAVAGVVVVGAVIVVIKRYDMLLFGLAEVAAALGMGWSAFSSTAVDVQGLKVVAAVFLAAKGIEDFKKVPQARRREPVASIALVLRPFVPLPGLWHLLTAQYGVVAAIWCGLLVGGAVLHRATLWGGGLIAFVYLWAFLDALRGGARIQEAQAPGLAPVEH